LCFGLSIFFLRKDWLTPSTPKLDDVPIIQTKEKDDLEGLVMMEKYKNNRQKIGGKSS
jgi:hypothetical protein